MGKNKILSIGAAAKYVGVSRDTLRRWEEKGKLLPQRSPTNRRYYTQQQLDDLVKKPSPPPPPSLLPPSAEEKKSPAENPLKIVFFSLGALILAVVIGLLVQIYLF